MKTPSMDETIFDAVLTRAFADAVAEELAEIERDCPASETVDYPEKYRKIERKAYRNRWGKSGGFRWSRGMKRAAAWILVVGLAGGALVMAVPGGCDPPGLEGRGGRGNFAPDFCPGCDPAPNQ